ncbi:MAG TPA: hypothetical protein VKQ05_05375, partial [Gemmatimonadales bacterium]|nr:hypothetical protein [Gemmatimonadales bacterium]
MSETALDPILNPRSIAVIGASGAAAGESHDRVRNQRCNRNDFELQFRRLRRGHQRHWQIERAAVAIGESRGADVGCHDHVRPAVQSRGDRFRQGRHGRHVLERYGEESLERRRVQVEDNDALD